MIITGIELDFPVPSPAFGRMLVAPLEKEDPAYTICDCVHPEYSACCSDWDEWDSVYNGGREFIETYVKKYSKRESPDDFRLRKAITPIPSFAKAAIIDIKNSIFQRIVDVTREGGPNTYIQACKGDFRGVDLLGSTMNWFIGDKIITELLIKRKVGVFVDAPSDIGPTIADKGFKHPYLYRYTAKDIRNWAFDQYGNLTSLLLRDTVDLIHPQLGLPIGKANRYRLFYLFNGHVRVALFDSSGVLQATQDLFIPEIPFVSFEISHSLLADVSSHQIALANIESSDIGYILRANYPFYTEQRDVGYNASHLRDAEMPDDVKASVGETSGFHKDSNNDIEVGTTTGRTYGKGLERPNFIAPPTAPLTASMEKQKALKDDIRLLVNLALASLQAASAESKAADLQGLEGGLSSIGLELEHGERRIAHLWALYENAPTPTTIKYPKRYSLKSDQDRIAEADAYTQKLATVPSKTFRQVILKRVSNILIGDLVSGGDMQTIYEEIDRAKVPTADPDVLIQDLQEGLVTKATASEARGYNPDEVTAAKVEYAERLALIQKSQSSPNPAARGVPDLAPNPVAAKAEKVGLPQRGPGQ